MQDKKRNKLQNTGFKMNDEELGGFTSLWQLLRSNEYDAENDIILPNSYLSEFVYILYVMFDVIKNPAKIKLKFNRLLIQIKFYRYWMKVR